ncbi:DUF3108 domain-containing protein [Massilia sp. S19_KUP03_FR1]|uniref:DUF3108 domain-containing protein n=1 Tax=Massilia sp. S19_KUP03_FR1 TaxID=3025503 RepID=UPI002FCD765C
MRKILTMLSLALLAHTGAMAAPPVLPFKLAPSADLDYAIQARQRGFTLPGEALVTWRGGDGKYSIQAVTKSPLLGKIVENRSEGTIDKYGLAPAQFFEKKFRKDATNTVFDRAANTIVFGEGKPTHALVGGEQDRASAAWQLAALARAAPDKFVAGSDWHFFVAGPRDGDPWTFKVIKREKVDLGAPLGEVEALHIVRAPAGEGKGQVLDIWLAPSLEWYPVRLRFSDDDDFVEQRLTRITKR